MPVAKRRHSAAPTFSIVIPTLNEGEMLSMTIDSISRSAPPAAYEILIIDDGSIDGSTEPYRHGHHQGVRLLTGGGLGVARARILGARAARGDFLVFLDAHCRVSPGWLEQFQVVLSHEAVGMVGPSFTKLETPNPRGCGMHWTDYALDPCWFEPAGADTPYLAPLTTGACQAFRRDVYDRLGGYDAGFERWGFEDVEICLRAWLSGYVVVAHPAVTVAHYFRESRDNYDVDDLQVTRNLLRMVYLHFSPTRIQRVLEAVSGNPYVSTAQDQLADSDVFDRRALLQGSRVYDDTWFFENVNGRVS